MPTPHDGEYLAAGTVEVRVAVPAEATLLSATLPALLWQAEALEVSDPGTAEEAADILAAVKARANALDERRKEMTGPLDEAKRSAMEMFRPALDALAEAEAALKAKLGRYRVALEHAQAEQRRLAEEAARRARAALEAEAAAREEQVRRARAIAEEQAAALLSAGNVGQAEALIEQAADIEQAVLADAAALRAEAGATLAVVAPVQAMPAGVSVRKQWRAEVTDLAALVAAVAAGTQPITLLQADMPALHRLAVVLRGQVEVPGVRQFQEQVVAARKR